MSNDGATGNTIGSSEEIFHLSTWAVLRGETQWAGSHVVEIDQLQVTVRIVRPQEDVCRVFVIVDAEVERALPYNIQFLRDVMTASRKKGADRGVSYIGHAFCNSL